MRTQCRTQLTFNCCSIAVIHQKGCANNSSEEELQFSHFSSSQTIIMVYTDLTMDNIDNLSYNYHSTRCFDNNSSNMILVWSLQRATSIALVQGKYSCIRGRDSTSKVEGLGIHEVAGGGGGGGGSV